MNNYEWLISRLDAFIRKYYANKVIRGTLIFLTCILGYILTASVGEYYLYLPASVKVVLVSLFVLLGAVTLIAWVIIPLSKMAKLGKVISHEQAATIVGEHFPEISDKLLNILQLKRQADGQASRELIEASIEQKANQISVFPITKAVDLSLNRRYLKYLVPVMIVATLIMIFSPSIFIDASERLLQPTKTFERPAPFKFTVGSMPLQAVRNGDFTLKITVDGSSLPAEVFVQIGGDRLMMQAKGKNSFEYTFKNVTEPIEFKLFAAGFSSQAYTLKVAQKPVLKAFKMNLNYPDYTGKKDETRNSLGDVSVPAGTIISWAFMAEHTDEATIRFGNGNGMKMPGQAMLFAHQARFLNDTSYTITLSNKASGVKDNYQYHVQVMPDQYPVIQLQEFKDSITGKQILLTGTAGDDYGIRNVLFHYEVTNEQNQRLDAKAIPLKVAGGSLTNFQHYFDVDVFQLQPGQKVNYFIEAWDNDGVHGSKASRSEVMTYMMYTANQLDSAINANSDQINSGLSNSSQQTKQMQNELREMQSKMLQSDKMDWEQQQSLQELGNKQMEMQKNLENIKKRFEEQIQQSQQKEFSEDLREKQEELKKQMDNLLDNELKEQMKKLQELMQKLNKENAFQAMKQMEQDNKLFNMDLERMKELMKQMEMQMRMEDMANKMEQLADKQLDLKKETDQKKASNEELSKKQDALSKELDKAMKEDMKEMNDLNKQLEKEQKLDDMQEDAKDAKDAMEESEEQLDQNQSSKSSKSQQKAAENLQSMAAAMKKAAGGMEGEQLDMDIKAVRQILSNLMRLSFDQEQLMNKARTTSTASQTYITNMQEQKRLHQNSQMIRDSLFVLSKRMPKLNAQVNKETTELERNMLSSVKALEDRKVSDAVTKQQFVMTRTNNLALMLNEMLSNLLQQQSDGSKSGSCNKPGGKKPKPGPGKQLSDIITKQQQLGNSMQQMQNARQQRDGKKEGDKEGKEGKGEKEQGQQSGGEYGNSEQLARMAQQQSAIRRQLQQLQSLMNSKGGAAAKELRELQEKMDKTETDLVNKKMSSELLLRQKEIMSRLLETEKALREQEQDDKRSSREPQNITRPIPPELQKHLADKQSLTEFYKTVPPQLKAYYKNMVEEYFKAIGTKSN